MRSVYIKALVLSFGILIFALAGFLVISRIMTYRMFAKGTPIARNAAMQFEEAGLEYENGGAKALAWRTLCVCTARCGRVYTRRNRDSARHYRGRV